MKLKVYSLKGVLFEGEARSLNINTKLGEITVLDNHLPIITLLEKGTAKIGLDGGKTENIEIESGFLEMDDENNLSVLKD